MRKFGKLVNVNARQNITGFFLLLCKLQDCFRSHAPEILIGAKMNKGSNSKKSQTMPEVPKKSLPDSNLWFRQVSDSLFQSTASGSEWNFRMNQSLTKTHGGRSLVGKSIPPVRSLPPGADPKWIWRKLLKEREKNQNLQV